ncbi:MAG TPA: hypothetical protein VLM75_06560 [Spirochaetota bacterium]|nr:hypothetical protein [Spirochaetota bacterium]
MNTKDKAIADNRGYAVAESFIDNVSLCKGYFTESCRNELREINKHEIIIKICEMLGPYAENLNLAEEIFEKIKYDTANYIVHHEYDSVNGVSTNLLLWLDGRVNPQNAKKLNKFIKKYLK